MSSGSTNIIPTRQCHQQIFAVDEESKSETCYEKQKRANDRRFLSTICFSDESTFTLNNEPNVQKTLE
jgi:hypothetical protein